jgi:hypothetical protein
VEAGWVLGQTQLAPAFRIAYDVNVVFRHKGVWRTVMPVLKPRYSKEEFSRRGREIYERQVRPHVQSQDDGKFVAIDIETGSYEIDEDDYTATERLLARNGDAQIWLTRVGHETAYRIGGGRSSPEAR